MNSSTDADSSNVQAAGYQSLPLVKPSIVSNACDDGSTALASPRQYVAARTQACAAQEGVTIAGNYCRLLCCGNI